SRDEMLNALAEQAVIECGAALDKSNVDEGSAQEVIGRIVKNMLPSVELYRILESPEYENCAALDAWQPRKDKLLELHYRWQASGELRVDLPAAWIAESMFILMRGAAAMVHDGQLARACAAEVVCSLLLNGVRAQAAVTAANPQSAGRT